MSESSGNKRIAKNTIMLYIRMGVTMLVSLYTSRIVLQQLGEVDYGLYSVVGGILSMFTFLNGALSEATSRFLTFELGAGNLDRMRKTFSAAVVNHWILAFAIILLAETVGLWFLYHKMVIPQPRMDAALWIYQCAIISTVVTITLVPYNSLIIAHEKMGVYAYLSILDVALKFVLVIALQYISFDKLKYWAVAGLVSSFISFFFYRFYCHSKFEEALFFFHKERVYYQKMFSYSFWDFLGSMSSLAQGQGLNLLLNIFFGPAINSARGIAMTVQGAVAQFSGNFVVASKPQIIKLYAQGKIQEMLRLVYNTSTLSYFLLFIFALPLCLEIHYVLTLWLVEFPDYTEIFTILIIGNSLIWSIKTQRVTMQHATGHIKLSNFTVGVILCATLPVAYLFLHFGYSPTSVFVITIIMTAISEFCACLVLRRSLNYSVYDYLFNVYGRNIAVSILSLVLPFCIHNLMEESFLRFCIVTVVSVVSVSFFAYNFGFTIETRLAIKVWIMDKLHQ